MSISVSYSLNQLGNTEFLSFAETDHSDVVAFASGGFAVSAEFTGDGSSTLVTYSGIGSPNGQSNGAWVDPAVALLADGSAVQVGTTDLGLFATIMNASGTVLGSGAISFTGGTKADVAGLKDGTNNYVVVNQNEAAPGDNNIIVSICNGISFVRSFVVDETTADDRAPAVTALADGGFAVAWERHGAGDSAVMYAVYNGDGSVRFAPLVLGSINGDISISALASGGFAIAYANNGWDGVQADITIATFAASGGLVNYDRGSSLPGADSETSLTTLSNGLLLASFTNGGTDIRAALYDPDGSPVLQSDLAAPLVIANNGATENLSSVAALDLARFVTTYNEGAFIAEKLFQLVRSSTGDIADDTITGDDAIDLMQGGDGNDTLSGGANNDQLDGGTGDDIMIGGLGEDDYFVDSLGDQVIEAKNAGDDLVNSVISLTLAANVELLALQGNQAIDGTGNSLANTIRGNGAANVLNGLRGADIMSGGDGNDTYIVDNLGDQVIEDLGDLIAGIDLVISSATHTLSANIENLRLSGAAALTGTGNGLDNDIAGNTGANRLFGLVGNDTMSGGGGNDTIDGGDDNDTLKGDAGDDTLLGRAGDDMLDGGTGNDDMRGSTGNDVYIVDSVGDKVSEAGGDGLDEVRSSVTFTLSSGVESLKLTTSALADGTGNTLANVLAGGAGANVLSGLGGNDVIVAGSGNDTLDGGSGADEMQGEKGNDIYIVDNVGDVVIEAASSGNDSVFSSLAAFTLTDNVENLVLTGAGNGSGTGNAMANVLTGNSGNNALSGGDGKDTLDGAAGADTLSGGASNDVFVFAAEQANGDTVVDFDGKGASAGDSLMFTGYGSFDDGARFIQLNATQWLVVSFGGGTQDTITFANGANIDASDFIFV